MSLPARRLGEVLAQLAIWVPLLIAAGHVVLFTVWTTWISFTASSLMPDYAWVGLRNYWSVTRTANFRIAYVNLAIFGLGFVVLTTIIGLLLAILLDQRVRGENVLRAIFLYPLAVSFVVTGTARRRSCCSGLAERQCWRGSLPTSGRHPEKRPDLRLIRAGFVCSTRRPNG